MQELAMFFKTRIRGHLYALERAYLYSVENRIANNDPGLVQR